MEKEEGRREKAKVACDSIGKVVKKEQAINNPVMTED